MTNRIVQYWLTWQVTDKPDRARLSPGTNCSHRLLVNNIAKPKLPKNIFLLFGKPTIFVGAAVILTAATVGGWMVYDLTGPKNITVKSTYKTYPDPITPVAETKPSILAAKPAAAVPLSVAKIEVKERVKSVAPIETAEVPVIATQQTQMSKLSVEAPRPLRTEGKPITTTITDNDDITVTVTKNVVELREKLTPPVASDVVPAWRQHAIASIDSGQPQVAIVIDDLGDNIDRGGEVAALPGPLTLAFMPYTRFLDHLLPQARLGGHELLLHLPMEPTDKSNNPGRNALLLNLSEGELRRRIDWNLNRFDGFVGVNNHMGSAFTVLAPEMRLLMTELKRRGLLFLDSKTTADSVGSALAREYSVPYVSRDIFLDNEQTPEAIGRQLDAVLRRANRNGSAIAIGHPYPKTIMALKEWLPSLAARGYQSVPLSAIVDKKLTQAARRS